MVHVHTGSQGLSFEQIGSGIRAAVDFAEAVNAVRPGQVKTMDVGGGLTVDFSCETNTSMEAWAAYLREHVPELFDGRYVLLMKKFAFCLWNDER